MTKKIRNIIFIILAVLFLIIAPAIVIYSLGWRFDWETKKIIQPGMFYFKVWPKNSQIYINGEAKKKTDIFFGSVLIENLLPGNYQTKIEKEGYYSWEKNLPIAKREVTEAKNVTLIPKDPKLSLISGNTEEFFFSPNRKFIITKENPPAGEETEWSLKTIEAEQNVKSHLISQQDLRIGALNLLGKLEPMELIDLTFSNNSSRAILTIGVKERIYYFIINIAAKETTPLDFLKIDTEKIFFSPQNNNEVLILADSEIKKADINTEEISKPLIKDVVSLYISGQDMFYINKEGLLFKTQDLDQKPEKMNITPFDVKQESKYELEVLNNNIFLKDADSLYMFSWDNLSFEKLLDSASKVKISGDSKKIAYFNDHEIWVMFLEKNYEQPQKEAKDKVFINRFSEDINDLFWYTDHYLIFSLQDKIKVAEIDDRDKINIVDLAEYKNPDIFFANKKLYILSENNLYASEELTP